MKTTYVLLLLLLITIFFDSSIMAQEPQFKIRGTLPWHNFLSGPTTWDENDYEASESADISCFFNL